MSVVDIHFSVTVTKHFMCSCICLHVMLKLWLQMLIVFTSNSVDLLFQFNFLLKI